MYGLQKRSERHFAEQRSQVRPFLPPFLEQMCSAATDESWFLFIDPAGCGGGVPQRSHMYVQKYRSGNTAHLTPGVALGNEGDPVLNREGRMLNRSLVRPHGIQQALVRLAQKELICSVKRAADAAEGHLEIVQHPAPPHGIGKVGSSGRLRRAPPSPQRPGPDPPG